MSAKNFILFYLILHVTAVLPLSVVWGQSQAVDSCLIDAHELKQVMIEKNTTLVDVRNADDFLLVQIPGSLNIKSHEIKTKVFLKGKQLVLIGYGYDIGTLSELCNTLKLNGFKSVHVLENGIAGWVNENHAGGTSQEINQSVFHLRPADIAGITDIKHVLVINITGKKSDLLDNYFVNVSTISVKDNKRLVNKIAKINKSKMNQFHYMIMVDRDGRRYSALHELNQIDKGMPVMFLSGGMDNLHRFDKKQSVISNKREFTLQNLKGCGY